MKSKVMKHIQTIIPLENIGSQFRDEVILVLPITWLMVTADKSN